MCDSPGSRLLMRGSRKRRAGNERKGSKETCKTRQDKNKARCCVVRPLTYLQFEAQTRKDRIRKENVTGKKYNYSAIWIYSPLALLAHNTEYGCASSPSLYSVYCTDQTDERSKWTQRLRSGPMAGVHGVFWCSHAGAGSRME